MTGCAPLAEAFVYGAMTRPMVFFRAFHAAFAEEMVLAIAYVWWYALSDRRRRLTVEMYIHQPGVEAIRLTDLRRTEPRSWYCSPSM
jgi:hypothetical protein